MTVPVVSSWTVNDSAGVAVSSLTLTKPTSPAVAVGDLLMLLAGNNDAGATDPYDAITGWTKEVAVGNATSDAKAVMFWRIADGTETATINVTTDADAEIYGWYVHVTGAHGSAPIDGKGAAIDDSSDPIDITGYSTTVNDCLGMFLGAFDAGDGNPFAVTGTGWSKTDEQNSGTGFSDASGCWGTKDHGTAGASGTVTIDATLSDGWSGQQWGIAPAAGVANTGPGLRVMGGS